VLSRFLDLEWRQALKVSTSANVVSTLVGIPATWIAYALIDYAATLPFAGNDSASVSNMAFLFSGWIGNRTSGFPPVSVTLLVMVVPFFFGSWFVEYRVSRRMLPDCDRHRLNRAVLIGNLASYALVAVILVVFYFSGN